MTLTPSDGGAGAESNNHGIGFHPALSRGSDHIDSVWIGGRRVDDDNSGFAVGSNGDIAFTVTVPLDVADGPNEVRIEGADHAWGQAVLTVPQATIVLDPSMGQRGTDFTIAGSGFIANSVVDYNLRRRGGSADIGRNSNSEAWRWPTAGAGLSCCSKCPSPQRWERGIWSRRLASHQTGESSRPSRRRPATSSRGPIS